MAWHGLGQCLEKKGLHDEAMAAHGRPTELKPDDTRAWFFLGMVHRDRGENEAAAEALRRALALASADPEAEALYVESIQEALVRLGRPSGDGS